MPSGPSPPIWSAYWPALAPNTPYCPCGSDCGCLTDTAAVPVAVTLSSGPVACTLNAAEMPDGSRTGEMSWAHVVDRVPIDGGTRLRLDTDIRLDQVALLVAAEQRRCSLFAFAITVDSRAVALEVRAPA